MLHSTLPLVCSLIRPIHSRCYTSAGVRTSQITWPQQTKHEVILNTEICFSIMSYCLTYSQSCAVFTLNQPGKLVHNSASRAAGLIDYWHILYIYYESWECWTQMSWYFSCPWANSLRYSQKKWKKKNKKKLFLSRNVVFVFTVGCEMLFFVSKAFAEVFKEYQCLQGKTKYIKYTVFRTLKDLR